ncbi:MAG TPA: hypothetical protein ENJ82_04520 [Bacteroidetes bacterium]|nr:hypothetical protein [Bacteroidota bacterium]
MTQKENKQAMINFRQRLDEIASAKEYLEWGFPNGKRADYLTHTIPTYLGDIQIGIPESWERRIPHLMRFLKEEGPPSPDVELNIPIEHNRKVSGLYASAGHEVWLCSRGAFTAFRGQIKKEVTFSFFDKWLHEIDDNGRDVKVIPVCSLSSPTIADDIAIFMKSVQELKELYKTGQIGKTRKAKTNTRKSQWGSSPEYEGTKSTGNKGGTEYEYLHGPLCNQLFTNLKSSVANHKGIIVTKNAHLDVALVEKSSNKAVVIFEVKTAALPSNQIYMAVGQLFYYRSLYGKSDSELFLVMPSNCKSDATEKFIRGLGINILYADSGLFYDEIGNEYVPSV